MALPKSQFRNFMRHLFVDNDLLQKEHILMFIIPVSVGVQINERTDGYTDSYTTCAVSINIITKYN